MWEKGFESIEPDTTRERRETHGDTIIPYLISSRDESQKEQRRETMMSLGLILKGVGLRPINEGGKR
jgi:hypothetical protein